MKTDYQLTPTGEYAYRYPRPSMTADAAVACHEDDGWWVLLIRRGHEPYQGRWAFPGGFMNMDETTAQCARRELEEETALSLNTDPLFVGLFDTVDRDPRGRVITAAYLFIVDQRYEVRGGDDAKEARWWRTDDLPDLAFDHKEMMLKISAMLKTRDNETDR